MGATRRMASSLSTRMSTTAEEHRGPMVNRGWPWLLWLFVLPFAAGVLQFVCWVISDRKPIVVIGLWIATGVLTWVVRKKDATRSATGRGFNVLSTAAAMVWLTLTVTYGWSGKGWTPLLAWLIGGPMLCAIHNIWASRHADNGPMDVHEAGAGKTRPKLVDGGYIVRAVTQRVPAVRAVANTAGNAFPILTTPWQAPALTAGHGQAAIEAAPGSTHQAADLLTQAEADEKWRRIRHNWNDYVTRVNPSLNGARLVPMDVKPWRIKTRVRLVRGSQTPDMVESARPNLASQNGIGLSNILVRSNSRNNSEAFIDWVLQNVLTETRTWEGPTHIGMSVADAPTTFGLYEDRVLAYILECAVTEAVAARLRHNGFNQFPSGKNLTHTIGEGMTGSGKSNVTRITIADWATRLDGVDWAIDTVKKYQTLGCIAGALDWLATQKAEAKALIPFLVDLIAESANYLGTIGLDNWEPGCGLPLVRLTVEEGGIIANELDKLDDVLNSARSAGIIIRMSFQRAHSALLDTNVRAAFGSTMSFGVKTLDDVFAMDEQLLAMGCDPSVWKDQHAGMLYWSTAGLDLERMAMALRSFKFDKAMGTRIVNEYAPQRDEWVRQNCKPWFEILKRIDRNGIYAKRTTGASVAEKLAVATRNHPAEGTTTVIDLAPAVPLQRPAAVPQDVVEADVVRDPNDRAPYLDDEGGGPTGYDDAREEEVSAMPTSDGDRKINLYELEDEMDQELADAARRDIEAGIRATDRLAPMPDEEAFVFPERDPGAPKMQKAQALGLVRRYLASRGAYWTFTPRDIYDPICNSTGLTPMWVRGVALATLVAEGSLEHSKTEKEYRVTDRLVDQVRGLPVGV